MSNLKNEFSELLKTGHVDTFVMPQAPSRPRGAGVRGGIGAPVAKTSFQQALNAEARMKYGRQKKDDQNLDPNGKKLASVFAEATPVNVSYKGRKAANWVENGITENQIEENILGNGPELEMGPSVAPAFEEFKAERAAMAPISNQSLEWQNRKKLNSMFVDFFRVDKPHSKFGRDIFNAYDIFVKTNNHKPYGDYMKYLINNGYPIDYTRQLFSYVKKHYAELKNHYEYYNKKRGATGGKRKTNRRRKLTRRKMTRRK